MDGEANLAKLLLDVIPPLMHQIRAEIRAVAKENLTVPQYRILSNIHRGICHVGQIAEYQGVSQPAMSKMVDGLVKKGLIARAAHGSDRRQIVLHMTTQGVSLFQQVKKLARVRLAGRLKGIQPEDRLRLEEALFEIEKIFSKQRREA